jgi:hypothetical protein
VAVDVEKGAAGFQSSTASGGSHSRGRDFHDQAVEDEAMVEAGGDERLVGFEGGFHDVLEAGEVEVL